MQFSAIQRRAPSWDVVVRRLNAFAPMEEADFASQAQAPDRLERHAVGKVLMREGEAAGRPRFILSGWACRQRVLPDGRRQIFDFLLPGDGLGFCGPHDPPALSSIVAVTPLELADGAVSQQEARLKPAAPLARALAVAASLEQAMLLDALVRLGRQTAYERMSHLLLELYSRLSIVGLAHDGRFSLPLTQEVLSDALGLSVVHVNRTLQQMRKDGLIELRSGSAILMDRPQLALIADFRQPFLPAF